MVAWVDYTLEEYCAFHRGQTARYEFVLGSIVAMLPEDERHDALAAALTRRLRSQFTDSDEYRVYPQNDLWLACVRTSLVTHPDTTAVRLPIATFPEEKELVTNPFIVCEVTSDATERKDRNFKLDHYRGIASLRAIVVVSHRTPYVEAFERSEDGRWILFGARNGHVPVTKGVGIDVDALYGEAGF